MMQIQVLNWWLIAQQNNVVPCSEIYTGQWYSKHLCKLGALVTVCPTTECGGEETTLNSFQITYFTFKIMI